MFRNLASTSARTLRTIQARSFSVSVARPVQGYPNDLSTNSKTKTDMLPDDKHAVNKAKDGDTNDVQSSNLKDGLESASGSGSGKSGGHATEQSDSAGGVANAKKEFPESPDPAIGMQDERGGRGG